MTLPRIARTLFLTSIFSALIAPTIFAQALNSNVWVTDAPVRAIIDDATKIYIGGDFSYVGPSTGAGVPLGSISGTPDGPFPKVTGRVLGVVPDGAGGWYVCGQFTSIGGVARTNLARVLADGSVGSWNPSVSGTNGWVSTVTRSGTTVYIGGIFDHAGGQARVCIAELDATTGLATAWNPGADLSVETIVPSGSVVYVGGTFSNIGGEMRNHIAALDATTGDATTWDPDANGYVNQLAVVGSLVYAVGEFHHIGGADRNYIAALSTADGTASSWDPDPDGSVYSLVVNGSTMFIGGAFLNVGGAHRVRIAALDVTTGNATSWAPNVSGATNSVFELALLGGTLFAGGDFQSMGGQDRRNLAAVDAASGVVLPWKPKAGGNVFALAASNATVYVGGDFTSVGGVTRNHLAALDPATGAATTWNPNADGAVFALANLGNRVFVGGQFTHVGGAPRAGLAELSAASGAPTLWNPGADNRVLALAVTDSTVYAGGEFASAGGQNRNRIAAFGINSGVATAWNPGADAAVRALVVRDNLLIPSPGRIAADAIALSLEGRYTIYAGGSFSAIGGQPRSRVAALDDSLGAALAFDPALDADPASVVDALALELDFDGLRLFAGGNFSQVGGEPRSNLAQLTPTGVDLDWNPGADQRVFALAGAGRFLYAGGAFSFAGGQPRDFVVAIDELSGDVPVWSVQPDGGVTALGVTSAGVLFGGFFKRVGNEPLSGLAGVAAVDVTGTPGGPNASTLHLACAPNPARAQLSFAFTLAEAGPVRLAVFDVTGRQIARVLDGGTRAAGPHVVPFTTAAFKPGLYFAQLSTRGGVVSQKFVVSR